MSSPAHLQSRLQHVVALIGRGDLANARAALTDLLSEFPNNPDALQLLGVVHRRSGMIPEAIAQFKASLAQNEKQPNVHNNLASAFLAAGDRALAERHYRRALALNPSYPDAQYNLALMIRDLRPGEAKNLLDAVVRANPNNGNAYDALSLTLGKLGDFQAAFAAASRASALSPYSHTAQHNLGEAAIVIRDYPSAERAYRAALALQPASDASWIGLGNALRSQERNEEAKKAYERAVVANPSNIDAHRLLNEMLWQTGESDRYLGSFPAAIAARPADDALRVAYANELLRIKQPAEALKELTAAARSAPDNAQLNDTIARAWSMSGDFEQAISYHRRASDSAPKVAAYNQSFLETLLKARRHAEALDNSTAALARFPFDQGILAMHTTALQILGDARHDLLADFAAIAKVLRIDPPEGFADEGAFNIALAERLRTLHATKNHPTDQTLRGGTQTFGALFGRNEPLVELLRAQIEKAITRYIAEMPDDPAHPFFARKAKKFTFAGSWSVCLHEGGFHTNHIHPQGWISSAYYVNLPPDTANATAHAGWFKMGETNLQLGAEEKIGRLVQPQIGHLVLFPSYFWHGTVPFQSDSERLTVAFDVVPA